MRFFHGGFRGIRGYILPPTETKRASTSDYVPNHVHRRDRVYITTDPTAAALYASVHLLPMVYEVIPEGDIEGDPDCSERGLSFACPRAKIVATHKVPGKTIKNARKALSRIP